MISRIFVIACLVVVAISIPCSPNQFSFQGTCFDQCPQDTVYTSADGRQCQECDITRFLVLSSDKSRCECASQTYYLPQYDSCAPCHYSCLTCTGPSEFQCATCDTSVKTTFRQISNQKCVCSAGYAQNVLGQTLKCDICHSDCQTCTGPTDADCNVCAAGRIKNQFGYCICSNSFVQDQNGLCVCPAPLVIASNGQCKSITSNCGYNQQSSPRPINNLTISSLANLTNFVRLPNNFTNIASAVASRAIPASSGNNCQCQKGFVKVKGKCTSCSTNEIYNSRKGICQCEAKAYKLNDQCIVCQNGQIFNQKTGECNCKKNSDRTQNNSCISCPSKSTYVIGVGCQCITNYYMVGRQCRKCNRLSDSPVCQAHARISDRPRALSRNQIPSGTPTRSKSGAYNIFKNLTNVP